MPPTYFGRTITPADNGSASGTAVTIAPPGSMLAGDLVLMMGLFQEGSGDWEIRNHGGQEWEAIGGPLNGFGCSCKRWWCTFNGTWINNLLTANQASLETDTTGWAAVLNCAITRSVTVGGVDGSAALRLSSSASGDMSAGTPSGVSGVPVLASKPYTAIASFRAGASARTCQLFIDWYKADGVFISSSVGSSISDSTSSFTKAFTQAFAPDGAVFARVRPLVQATGAGSELHYVDAIQLSLGFTEEFAMPSLTSPKVETDFGSSDTLSGCMIVFRPSAEWIAWELELQTFQFIDAGTAPFDAIFPSQTVKENNEVVVVEWHRDVNHTMTLQSAGWANPNSESEWANTPGGNQLVWSVAYKIHAAGTTGNIVNRANSAAFMGALYTAWKEVWDKPEANSKQNRLARSKRW